VLGGAAAQYLLLAAEFVAVTQVLVYIGAVTVLFLFGTMLTRRQIGRESDLNNKLGCSASGRACSARRASATC
jgi:NADH-quinone oxidoreductase subunit J